MELTREERELLESYLKMNADYRGWIVGAVVGAAICAGALVAAFLRLLNVQPVYLLLALIVGMVVVELALTRRDNTCLAGILQKYDTEVRRLKYPEEDEETV